MLLDQPIVDVHAPITPEEAERALRLHRWANDPALKMIVQDAANAESHEVAKQWVLGWGQAITLFQSPHVPRYWPGTTVEAASIPFYTVAKAVNTIVPQAINGMFAEDPPFAISPRPRTSLKTVRANAEVLAYQLDEIGLREQVRLGSQNAVLFGTGIWKWGWEEFSTTRKMYARKRAATTLPEIIPGQGNITIEPEDEEFEEVVEEVETQRPFFESVVDLRHVLVDPGLAVPDIRKAKYVVHRQYMTWEQLEKLRDRPGYTIPSQADLLALFQTPKEPVEAALSESNTQNPLFDARALPRYDETTVDPFNQPLEVLERWDGKNLMVALQKKLVMYNGENEYGVIPFFSINWWDVPGAFWGMGLGRTVGTEQRIQQGLTNYWLDNVSLNLNGVYVRIRGQNVPTQQVRVHPGKIIDVEKENGFMPLKRTDAVPEVAQILGMSEMRAGKVSGATEEAQGVAGRTAHSNFGRSAVGAAALSSASQLPVTDFVEKLANQVFIPFLYHAHEMNRAMLPAKALKQILNDELGSAYFTDGGDVLDLMNARVKFTVTAAAKMQAKKAFAQLLPFVVQLLTSKETTAQLAIQGKKIDIEALLAKVFAVADWKDQDSLIVDMSEDDKKRFAEQSQGAAMAKMQVQAALLQQKFQNDQKLIDQQDINRAGRDAFKAGLEEKVKSGESVMPGAGAGVPSIGGLGAEPVGPPSAPPAAA